jgi:hypothetical protein
VLVNRPPLNKKKWIVRLNRTKHSDN